MSNTRNVALLVGLCLALAACDRTPAGDLTEPTADGSDAAVTTEGVSLLAAANTWTTKRSLSPARSAMAAAKINGIIYLVGGHRGDGTALARVDGYTIATNTWSQVRSLPAARVEPNGATMINGKLYVSGGRNSNGNLTRTLFVYDPGSNSWTRKADMPRGGGCGGAQGVISGKLYVYTGCYSSTGVFFRYSPTTDTWATLPAPPTDHKTGAGGVINGKFYLAGGFTALGCTIGGVPAQCDDLDDALDVYDPATDSWTTKASMLTKRSGMAAAVMDGKLFVVGGSEEFTVAKLEVYDPGTNAWTMKAPLPTAESDGAATMAGSRIFFISGSRVYAYNLGTTETGAPGSAAVTLGTSFFTSDRNGSTNPAVDTVAVGGTVTWTWVSGLAVTHSVQSIGSPGFPSSAVMGGVGTTHAVTFSAVGTYQYNCARHPNTMTGRVIVK
jgi:N-acetylneuraminic acid mutarotase